MGEIKEQKWNSAAIWSKLNLSEENYFSRT